MVPAVRLLTALSLAHIALGCASSQKQSEPPLGQTRQMDVPPTATDASAAPPAPAPPEDVIFQHAAPILGYRTVDGRAFKRESLLTHLADADVLCVGERHDDPADHYAQLEVVNALLERREIRGFELGLGLEMVRGYNQPVLTEFTEGKISEDDLEERTAWSRDWGFPIQYYRPQMREVLVQGGDLIALGVAPDITHLVAQQGLDWLSDNDRRALPQLDTEDALHRELFELLMEGHPPLDEADFDNYYLAQVIWDEVMAERAYNWVSQHRPGRKLVILAGAAHCHPHAIPQRIARRGPVRVVSVLPASKQERPAATPTHASASPTPSPAPPSSPGAQGGAGEPAGVEPAGVEPAPGGTHILPAGMTAREAFLTGYDYLLLLDE